MPRETIASVKAAYRKKFREAEAAFAEREKVLAEQLETVRGEAAIEIKRMFDVRKDFHARLAEKDARIAELLAANNCFEQKARDARADLDEAKGVIGHLARVVDTLANHKA